MPSYEFRCLGCRKVFTVVETFEEHDRHRERCPKCKGRQVEQVIRRVEVKTSKKS